MTPQDTPHNKKKSVSNLQQIDVSRIGFGLFDTRHRRLVDGVVRGRFVIIVAVVIIIVVQKIGYFGVCVAVSLGRCVAGHRRRFAAHETGEKTGRGSVTRGCWR